MSFLLDRKLEKKETWQEKLSTYGAEPEVVQGY